MADRLDKLPGKVEVRKAVVGALDAIKDKDIRKQAFEMLEAANGASSDDYTPSGRISKQDAEDASDKIEKMAKAYASENKTTEEVAYLEVLKTKAGRELYAQTLGVDGAAVSIGDVTTDANGKFVNAASGQNIVGTALTTADAADEFIAIQYFPRGTAA